MFWPQGRIRHSLIGSHLLAGEDQMNCVTCLGLALWKKHVHSSGVTECKAMTMCNVLDSVKIRPLNHDVNVFRVSHGGRLDPVHLQHDSTSANQFVRDLRRG